MRFLVDANLPPMLASGLLAAGHDCDHTSTLLGADAQDTTIASTANELTSILMSKDLDFVDLVRRGVLQVPFVHIRLGNMSARATCAIIWSRLPQIVMAIEGGYRIVEIR